METQQDQQLNKNSQGKKKRGAPKGNKNSQGKKNALGHDGKPFGRVVTYEATFAAALIEHFKQQSYRDAVYEETTEYFINGKIKRKTQKKKQIAEKLATFFNFADKIGVTYRTLCNWRTRGIKMQEHIDKKLTEEELKELGVLDIEKEKELAEFAEAYEYVKEMQKETLIDLGLSGAAPPASFIFVTKNLTDMKDKSEQDVTSGGKSLGVAFLPQKKPLPDEENTQ